MPLPPKDTAERRAAESSRDKTVEEALRWLPGISLGLMEYTRKVLRAVWRAGWIAHEELGK